MLVEGCVSLWLGLRRKIKVSGGAMKGKAFVSIEIEGFLLQCLLTIRCMPQD